MERPPRTMLQKVTDPAVYVSLLGVEGALRFAGPRGGYGLASLLGRLWLQVFKRRRQIIHRNLDLAFGGRLDTAEKDRIAFECCRHALAALIDVLVRNRIDRDSCREFFTPDPLLEETLASSHPRGLALLCAHIGSWEMGQYFCGLLGRPVSPVIRSLDNPFLDRHAARQRTTLGEDLIRKTGALPKIRNVLRRGDCVGILADQNCPTAESYVPFFGRPAATYAHYARVLIRQGCTVLFSVCLRDGFQFRFRSVSRRLEIPAVGSVAARTEALVASYMSALEEVVARHPEQYLWMHKRWRRRPEGLPSFYDDLDSPLELAPLGDKKEPIETPRAGERKPA